jgi:hypothetical protein
MVRRLFLGLVIGLVIGGAVAAGVVAGLGVQTFASSGGAVIGYLAAALTGTLTGLVAGKPIWSSGGKIEAGLKAFFGAVLGAGLMFALQRWAGAWQIPLPAIGALGSGPVADLPAESLPLLAAVLGGLFELDNTAGGAEPAKRAREMPDERRRVADGAGRPKARVAGANQGVSGEAAADEDADAAPKRTKR